MNGYPVLYFTDRVEIKPNVSLGVPHNIQRVQMIIDECKKRRVDPHHFGYDATSGSGNIWSDLVTSMWSADVWAVLFSGSPSDRPVGNVGAKPASKCYVDRVSELWFAGREFMRSGQLMGVDNDLAKDMIARRKDESQKKGNDILMRVESKRKMKKRIGRSPDKGDAAMILVDLCRARLKFRVQTTVVVNVAAKRRFRHEVALAEAQERSFVGNLARDGQGVPSGAPVAPQRRRLRVFVSGSGWGGAPALR